MLAGLTNPSQLDSIYTGDFQDILLPYLYVRLYQRARSKNLGIDWTAVSEGRVDGGWLVIPPDITNVDIRESMCELGLLYVQHLREKNVISSCSNGGSRDKRILKRILKMKTKNGSLLR